MSEVSGVEGNREVRLVRCQSQETRELEVGTIVATESGDKGLGLENRQQENKWVGSYGANRQLLRVLEKRLLLNCQ